MTKTSFQCYDGSFSLELRVWYKYTYICIFAGWETGTRPLADASENLAGQVENRPGQVEFCIGYIRDCPVWASAKIF